MGHNCNNSNCQGDSCKDKRKFKLKNISNFFKEHIKSVRWMYYNRGLSSAIFYFIGMVPVKYVKEILNGVQEFETKFRKTDAERNEFKAKFLRYEDESKELNKIIEERNYLKMELESRTITEKELGKEMDKLKRKLMWIEEHPEYLLLKEKWTKEEAEKRRKEEAEKMKQSEERIFNTKVQQIDKNEMKKRKIETAKKLREKLAKPIQEKKQEER